MMIVEARDTRHILHGPHSEIEAKRERNRKKEENNKCSGVVTLFLGKSFRRFSEGNSDL